MQHQKVSFKTSSGNTIVAYLDIPSETYNGEISIIAHGLNSHKEGTAKEFVQLLLEKGRGALSIDFFGHGESEGDFSDLTVSEGVEDVLAAIDFLRNRASNDISLIGTSFGGICAILAAARTDKQLTKLALRAPVSDYYLKELMTRSSQYLQDWKRKGLGDKTYIDFHGEEKQLKSSFLKDIMMLRPYQEAWNIKIPTFIVHGELDESVPVVQSEMLTKVIPTAKLKIIEGADHPFSNEDHKKEALERIVRFIVGE
jgi:dipeptidyl aminopeptidase/acylaminoacyl peptidase